MRLLKYIVEEEKAVAVEEKEKEALVKKNCKQYLRLLKGRRSLARGMRIHTLVRPNELGKKKVRKDRIPRGTHPETFAKFNEWLESAGHVRRDQAFMTTSNIADVGKFGAPYFVFPIGKFNYTWMRAKDFNIDDRSTGWDTFYPARFVKALKREKGKIMKHLLTPVQRLILKKVPSYFITNKDFDIAYDKKFEIWFDCKEYYFIEELW